MLEIVPFSDDHLDAAARLLAARQVVLRAAETLLSERYTEPDAARRAIAATLAVENAAGVAALRGGRMVGYLIGSPRIDTIWGRIAWVRFAGHARALDEPAIVLQDLYATLAPGWVARGCFEHYVLAPAGDQEAELAWFALGFGREMAHAVREIEPVELVTSQRLTIRLAGPSDLEDIMAIAGLIASHQAGTPVFGAWMPESHDWWRKGWAEHLSTPASRVWLAFQGQQIVGAQLWTPVTGEDDPMAAEAAVELTFAATRPEARGQGVSRSLMAAGLADARARGAAVVIADWRTANLLSSRYWPRRGFRTVAHRLFRAIDPRIAWARG